MLYFILRSLCKYFLLRHTSSVFVGWKLNFALTSFGFWLASLILLQQQNVGLCDWNKKQQVIVISKFLKRYSKAKRTRAPAYSWALPQWTIWGKRWSWYSKKQAAAATQETGWSNEQWSTRRKQSRCNLLQCEFPHDQSLGLYIIVIVRRHHTGSATTTDVIHPPLYLSIVSMHLYSASCSAHQSEAPVRGATCSLSKIHWVSSVSVGVTLTTRLHSRAKIHST